VQIGFPADLSLGTSLYLTLAGSIRCANRLSCRFVYARYNLNRTTALLTRFYFYAKNPFKSLRPGTSAAKRAIKSSGSKMA
jgi:hypothetical protein